jgi:hypothetical protein
VSATNLTSKSCVRGGSLAALTAASRAWPLTNATASVGTEGATASSPGSCSVNETGCPGCQAGSTGAYALSSGPRRSDCGRVRVDLLNNNSDCGDCCGSCAGGQICTRGIGGYAKGVNPAARNAKSESTLLHIPAIAAPARTCRPPIKTVVSCGTQCTSGQTMPTMVFVLSDLQSCWRDVRRNSLADQIELRRRYDKPTHFWPNVDVGGIFDNYGLGADA